MSYLDGDRNGMTTLSSMSVGRSAPRRRHVESLALPEEDLSVEMVLGHEPIADAMAVILPHLSADSLL